MYLNPVKKLSVIIPCYNESTTLELVVEEVLSADTKSTEKELIIIDDRSSDNSWAIIKKLEKQNQEVRGFRRSTNKGKGAALKYGFLKSSGDVVIIQDADREYDPRDYNKMLDIFREDRADIVFGSRFSGGSPRRVVYFANTVANKLMTRMSAVMSGLYVTDIHTCYIMFEGNWIRSKARSLRSNRFGFNPEIVARIAKERQSLRICETGISYYGRTRIEGKKIGMRDGVKAVWEIIYYNLTVRKPKSS